MVGVRGGHGVRQGSAELWRLRRSTMDVVLDAVAERLAAQFPQQPGTTVLRVVRDCVEEFPDGGELFVEQAARSVLASGRR
jgi:hypothetical protein